MHRIGIVISQISTKHWSFSFCALEFVPIILLCHLNDDATFIHTIPDPSLPLVATLKLYQRSGTPSHRYFLSRRSPPPHPRRRVVETSHRRSVNNVAFLYLQCMFPFIHVYPNRFILCVWYAKGMFKGVIVLYNFINPGGSSQPSPFNPSA